MKYTKLEHIILALKCVFLRWGRFGWRCPICDANPTRNLRGVNDV